jgi:hypothetical protein
LTNSRASAFRECPRKCFYLYEAGIRTVKTETPLRFGSQFHKGLEIYNKTGDIDKGIEEAIKPYSFYPPWILTPDDRQRFIDERTVLIELLAAHVDHWSRLDPIQVIKPEAVFIVPIINPRTGHRSKIFDAAGQRDAIAIWRRKNALVEYKTTSADISPESVYWQRLQLDSQISHYFLGGLMEGIALDTVLYDVTRKPKAELFYRQMYPVLEDGLKVLVWKADGTRVTNKDGSPAQRCPAGKTEEIETVAALETIESHAERIRADITERPEAYFQRREIARSRAEIEEYQGELWQTAQQMRYSQNNQIWVRNGNICFRYFSSRPCPYWDICTTGRHLETMTDSEIAGAGFERLQNVHPELIKEDVNNNTVGD